MEYENFSGEKVVRASQRFGKLKKLDVIPFMGDVYVHITDKRKEKCVRDLKLLLMYWQFYWWVFCANFICKISKLCLLSNLKSLSIVNLLECRNLVDKDFKVLNTCSNIDQLYVSFTKISPVTAVVLSRHLKLTDYDVCGVELRLEHCEEILDNSYQTLLLLYIFMIGNEIDEQSVNRRLRSVYIDTSVHIHSLHLWRTLVVYSFP